MIKTFTAKDKIGIIIFSSLLILSNFFFNITTIITKYENLNIINHDVKISSAVFLTCWISILGLIFYCAKGLWRNHKTQEKTKFLSISLIIFIFYSVIAYPYYIFPISSLLWIMIDFVGICYILIFLCYSVIDK
jgi:hypothetical protein